MQRVLNFKYILRRNITMSKLIEFVQKDKRGILLTYIFAFFSLFYHVAFLFVFKSLNVYPLFYFNFFSIVVFQTLAILLLCKKNHINIFSLGLAEVAIHQILADYLIGPECNFHYLLLAAALTFLVTCEGKFLRPIIYSIFAAVLFFLAEIFSHTHVPVYTIPKESLLAIKSINTFFGVFLILICVFIYTFIVNHIEENLEIKVKNQTDDINIKNRKVNELQNHIIYSLASLVENRDSDTGAHINRTSSYIRTIAKAAKEKGLYKDILTDEYILTLGRAAPLHDIGKIVIPDAILKKPGKLTDEEFSIMKTHTIRGADIVEEIVGVSEDKVYIKTAQDIALSHHEKWNGTGYPYKLEKEKIPLCARIMALADVFDALVTKRCYKESMSMDEAFDIIKNGSGTQFDPELVEIFLESRSEIEVLTKLYSEDKA